MLTNFTPKSPLNFECCPCYFKCSNKKDYNRHILTHKHKMLTNVDINVDKKSLKTPYHCECGKEYSHRQSLSVHKKKCNFKNNEEIEPEKDTSENVDLVKYLMKENSQLRKEQTDIKELILEVIKNGTHNTNISNNNNKTFNLQVYLNETCKDAINLTDFVDSIKVQIKDLEKVGEKGYAEGISEIFINNLQQLNTHSRPIHCSDSKRETLYIKDENQWNKDDEQKTTLTKAIKQVANKNIKQISEWQKINPKYKDPESKQNDKYMKIVLNSMSGSTNEEANKNYEKIIKNVIKETVIDKCN